MSQGYVRSGMQRSDTTSADHGPTGLGTASWVDQPSLLRGLHYWVLMFDASGARLCLADGSCLREIRGHGLPFIREVPAEADVDRLVRAIDWIAGEFIGGTPWPIVVAGAAGDVGCFCARSRYRDRVVAVARGTYPGMPLPLLAPLAANSFWRSFRFGSAW